MTSVQRLFKSEDEFVNHITDGHMDGFVNALGLTNHRNVRIAKKGPKVAADLMFEAQDKSIENRFVKILCEFQSAKFDMDHAKALMYPYVERYLGVDVCVWVSGGANEKVQKMVADFASDRGRQRHLRIVLIVANCATRDDIDFVRVFDSAES